MTSHWRIARSYFGMIQSRGTGSRLPSLSRCFRAGVGWSHWMLPRSLQTSRLQNSKTGECEVASTILLARKLWRRGRAKILTDLSAKVARFDNQGAGAKSMRGYVCDYVDASKPRLNQEDYVSWQLKPPGMIKVLARFEASQLDCADLIDRPHLSFCILRRRWLRILCITSSMLT